MEIIIVIKITIIVYQNYTKSKMYTRTDTAIEIKRYNTVLALTIADKNDD